MLRPVPSVGCAGAAEARRRLAEASGIVATCVIHLTGAGGPVPACALVLRFLHFPHLHPVSGAMPTTPAVGSLASCGSEYGGRDQDSNEDQGDQDGHTNPDRDALE
jgi:hypothetical protein